MIGTFAMVLFFTMLKELYEDNQRKKSDNELNNKKTRVFEPKTGQTKHILWKDIMLGDIIKVCKDEEIPADLLLCCAPKDVVFVSTMNLDGETNLKEKILELKEISSIDKMS
jgi:phospholipid-transporting ATPase